MRWKRVGILALAKWGHNPVVFVLLTGLVFFAWGEIYSLFPATCGDTFGSKYATTNAGLLYTAKGTAALLVPISSVIADATGKLGHGLRPRLRRQRAGRRHGTVRPQAHARPRHGSQFGGDGHAVAPGGHSGGIAYTPIPVWMGINWKPAPSGAGIFL